MDVKQQEREREIGREMVREYVEEYLEYLHTILVSTEEIEYCARRKEQAIWNYYCRASNSDDYAVFVFGFLEKEKGKPFDEVVENARKDLERDAAAMHDLVCSMGGRRKKRYTLRTRAAFALYMRQRFFSVQTELDSSSTAISIWGGEVKGMIKKIFREQDLVKVFSTPLPLFGGEL